MHGRFNEKTESDSDSASLAAIKSKGESLVQIQRCPATVMGLDKNLSVRMPADKYSQITYTYICEVQMIDRFLALVNNYLATIFFKGLPSITI